MTKSSASRPEIDVAILGAGIAGTVLAAVLARNGAKVQIFDAGSHPRFAIGESTTPHTSTLMRLVGERYDVTELKLIAAFHNVQAHVTRSGGIKRGFGFCYHREGEKLLLEEFNEFAIPRATHMENHWFRQDLDEWVLTVALKYGARIKQNTPITDVDVADDGVTVTSATGEKWRARFIVDASGLRSPLAAKFDLREKPSRLRHHSWSVFTHMLDVTPYEDLFPAGTFKTYNQPSSTTLHHVFKGGWLWVIPFNNHIRATNPLVSVGLQLDPRVHPKPEGILPEQIFHEFIGRYPDIARQFTNARAAREWVSTGRLQYSPKRTVGYRWCLTSHAAGFIDPLFSRGMSNTFEIVNSLGWRILDALRDDDFSVERFEPVQTVEQGQLNFNDNLVANAYTSFCDYDLWDAWFRVWALGQFLSTAEIGRAYMKVVRKRDATAALAALESIAPDGDLPPYPPLRQMYAEVSQAVRDVAEGRRGPGDAAKNIMTLLSTADFIPPAGFDFANPRSRYFGLNVSEGRKNIKWARQDAPEEIGRILYEQVPFYAIHRFTPTEFDLAEEFRAMLAERKHIGKWLRVPNPR
jgi:FADH2 O2-dependent halogenase